MGRRVRTRDTNLLFRHRLRALGPAAALLLASCGGSGEQEPAANETVAEGESPTLEWTLQEQGDGASLALVGASGDVEMRLICPGRGELMVNVPTFRPVGSEERLTFGQSGTVETLVADPSGDRERGGVTATGAVPANLEGLLSGRVAANYGSQNSGPHPQLSSDLVKQFVDACGAQGDGAQQAQAGSPPASQSDVSACLIQDGNSISEMGLHAVGTEPFWAADIKGRCVTYSTPENIEGTRIWTKFDGSRDSGVWTGYYRDQRFVLRTHPQPRCSDGMSDKVYPVGVTLVVGGEERIGCAEYR